MKLRRTILFAALAFGFASPSLSQITGDTTINGVTLDFGPNPTHLSNKIKDDSVPDGLTLALPADSGDLVDFTAPTTLEHSGNGGFATVSGLGNGSKELGFASLLIDPQSPMDGFTDINFALKALGNGNDTFYADFVLNLVGGGQIVFANVAVGTGGLTHYGFSSVDDRLFASLFLTDLRTLQNGGSPVNFESIRQVSINLAQVPTPPPGVPEPATWAMMLMGFGAAGAAIRHSRRKETKLHQIA
jgi:hypothetical protein